MVGRVPRVSMTLQRHAQTYCSFSPACIYLCISRMSLDTRAPADQLYKRHGTVPSQANADNKGIMTPFFRVMEKTRRGKNAYLPPSKTTHFLEGLVNVN